MAAAIPFAIKAAPWIAQAGGALLGKKLSGPSKGQKAAIEGTQQSMQELRGISQPLLQQGMGLAGQGAGYLAQGGRSLQPAAQYYGNILSSRRGATESLAPETTTALEYYRGAEGKTRRTMQGGARDYALAELDRQKVGQLANMLPAARANAAQGMERIGGAYGQLGGTGIYGGGTMTGQGVNAASTAAYLGSGLFDQASRLREQAIEGGSKWGTILFDIAKQIPWGKFGQRGSGMHTGRYGD